MIATFSLPDLRPDPARALSLGRSHDSSLINSLEYLLTTLRKAEFSGLSQLEETAYEISNRINTDATCRLAGPFVAGYTRLEHSMRQELVGDVQTAVATLPQLRRYSDNLRVVALGDASLSDADHQTVMEVFRREHPGRSDLGILADSPHPNSANESCDGVLKAIDHIETFIPELMNEIRTIVSDIFIIRSDQVNAASSYLTLGTVFFRELQAGQTWTTYVEHLAHEAAHHLLYAIWSVDRIFEGSSGGAFRSPLRPDDRPLSAVFHAMFVLARIIYVLGETHEKCDMPFVRTAKYNFPSSAGLVQQFYDAFNVIEANAELNAVGEEILQAASQLVDSYDPSCPLFQGRA